MSEPHYQGGRQEGGPRQYNDDPGYSRGGPRHFNERPHREGSWGSRSPPHYQHRHGGGGGGAGAGKNNRRLYINQLPQDVNEDLLSTIFSKFGNIQRCDIPMYNSGNNKGFAFIVFDQSDAAKKAIDKADNITINGSHVSIEFARDDRGFDGFRGGRGMRGGRFPQRGGYIDRPHYKHYDNEGRRSPRGYDNFRGRGGYMRGERGGYIRPFRDQGYHDRPYEGRRSPRYSNNNNYHPQRQGSPPQQDLPVQTEVKNLPSGPIPTSKTQEGGEPREPREPVPGQPPANTVNDNGVDDSEEGQLGKEGGEGGERGEKNLDSTDRLFEETPAPSEDLHAKQFNKAEDVYDMYRGGARGQRFRGGGWHFEHGGFRGGRGGYSRGGGRRSPPPSGGGDRDYDRFRQDRDRSRYGPQMRYEKDLSPPNQQHSHSHGGGHHHQSAGGNYRKPRSHYNNSHTHDSYVPQHRYQNQHYERD